MQMPTYRLGIDIGGTFTDGALVDEDSGELSIVKVLTTPANPAEGFMEAVEQAQQKTGFPPEALKMVVHATTIATNALIEGNKTRIGMLATEGFRDVLEIGYQTRPRLYDIFQKKPVPLVPRRWSIGIPERLDHHGQVLKPLDEAAVERAVAFLKAEGVEALVVCFLHSYINPAHEQRAAEIARAAFPEAFLSVSSEVCPEFREFPRASTAAVNAAVMPVVSRYVDDIQSRLAARKIEAPFYIMQSNGGVMNAEAARDKPVFMVESGPSAGVIAAAALAREMGFDNVISFDMGGTTAKVGLVRGGQPTLSTEYEVGSLSHSPIGEGKGSGYPVRTPVIDLVEVGAGGGSLAWIDPGGSLRTGPQSAGAEPGPACYGRGGTRPTLTDANLLLGRLNADYFLGGQLKLDTAAARAALEREIAAPLGLEIERAAQGVVDIANAGMIAAMRLISVQRGYDPRDFSLVAFGGAGPLHAGALAAELEIPTVIVPPSPGVASAVGLLMTDIRHEFVATRRHLLAAGGAGGEDSGHSAENSTGSSAENSAENSAETIPGNILARNEAIAADLNAVFSGFEERAEALLAGDRESWGETSLVRSCDLRYKGQSHELQVVLSPGEVGAAALARLRGQFEEAHKRAYGYVAPGDAIEMVNLRLTAVGKLPPLPRKRARKAERATSGGGGGPDAALKEQRPLWLKEEGRAVDCPVYDRYALRAGDALDGPAVVEEMDASTVVPGGFSARLDDYGNLVMTRK